MSEITIRSSLAGLEEYEVETIEAKIIVNANESNYPVPASIQQEIEEKTKSFLFNRYPPIKCETLCSLIAETLGVDIDKVRVGNGSSELLQMKHWASILTKYASETVPVNFCRWPAMHLAAQGRRLRYLILLFPCTAFTPRCRTARCCVIL